MKKILKNNFFYKTIKNYRVGRKINIDPINLQTVKMSKKEVHKKVLRTDVINFLLSQLSRKTTYLEIGVRNPDDNYNHINANKKHSVDPGIEFDENPVDFKMTSDDFFTKLNNNKVLSKNIKFDIIFIDGLHIAEQVDRDIINSLKYIKDDGFIVLHDCNPPTEWHARENYSYKHTPASGYWNGTTWKAFLKWRSNCLVKSCCIDSDWGIGVLSKTQLIGQIIKPPVNLFYEFNTLDKNRKEHLNLIQFDEFKKMVISSSTTK